MQVLLCTEMKSIQCAIHKLCNHWNDIAQFTCYRMSNMMLRVHLNEH